MTKSDSSDQFSHVPVLLDEVVEALSPKPGETYLDCTAGLGGHAERIAEQLAHGEGGERGGRGQEGGRGGGSVILCDLDHGNLARAQARLKPRFPAINLTTLHGNFADAPRKLSELRLAADMVLADLGFASSQMDDASRGFSFMRDGPLDMRLDPSAPITAAELVNTMSEPELASLIFEYGEDRHARRIAQKLVRERASAPIETTARLAELVVDAVPPQHGPKGGIHPATRTFQALRIAVNDELGNLRRLLDAIARGAALAAERNGPSHGWLNHDARIGIISFHSLEDRLVKQAFADLVERGLAERLTRKPVEASDAEVQRNPRARSAKLRAVRFAH